MRCRTGDEAWATAPFRKATLRSRPETAVKTAEARPTRPPPHFDPRKCICLIGTATVLELPPIGVLARADVVPMHRTQRVRTSGVSVG
jgi:hypothetical protein